MTDVFVSYSKADKARARRVVEALRADGLEVWWDEGIGSGASWREEIRRHIEAARVVAALWSSASVRSEWVLEEAELGKARGALCPALLDEIAPPLGFGGVQASNLSGWSGDRKDPAWLHFADSVRAAVHGMSPPQRSPPRPRRNPLPAIGAVLGALAAIATLVTTLDAAGVIRLFDRAPAQATAAERSAFAQAQAAGCDGLRAYVADHPHSPLTARAEALIAARRATQREVWEPLRQPAPVVASSGSEAMGSEAAACASARLSAQRQADAICALHEAAGARAVSAAFTGEPACACENAAAQGGPPLWRCVVDAVAQCRGERLLMVTEEACG